jgi:hypothetical protein
MMLTVFIIWVVGIIFFIWKADWFFTEKDIPINLDVTFWPISFPWRWLRKLLRIKPSNRKYPPT